MPTKKTASKDAKKTTTKKAPAKKTTTKKAPAKKTATKKTPVKKTTATPVVKETTTNTVSTETCCTKKSWKKSCCGMFFIFVLILLNLGLAIYTCMLISSLYDYNLAQNWGEANQEKLMQIFNSTQFQESQTQSIDDTLSQM